MPIGWNTGSGSTPGTSGPVVVYDLDWAALASQLGIADGPVVVDGVSWEADNTGNATQFDITNGAGLQVTATAGAGRDWDGVAPDAPGLFVPLLSLASELARYDLPLTIWSYFPSYTVPSSQNAVSAGVWSPQTPYSGISSSVCFFRSGAAGPAVRRGSTFALAADPDPAHDVLVWRSGMLGTAECYSGTWASGWPARDALTVIGHDVSGYGATLSTSLVLRRAGACLVYAAETGASSGAPSFTLARTRIEIG